jgi:hypothetical protein
MNLNEVHSFFSSDEIAGAPADRVKKKEINNKNKCDTCNLLWYSTAES